MTEEIIKECKNCDALGIDSEIGVYYCCLSHRQDDLPKEFTCNDFTPNNQLKRLEQREKALTEIADNLQKRNHDLTLMNERLEQKNKELKEWKDKVVKLFESACRCKYLNEGTDICSYTNEKCININKCTYKYQELSDTYRSALEEIRTYLNTLSSIDNDFPNTETYLRIQGKINECIGE